MTRSPALIIAAYHLRRLARRPGLIVLLLAIPVTLAVIEYAAFGRTAAAGKMPPSRVLLIDQDQSLVSRMVPQLFAGGDLKSYIEVMAVDSVEAARRQFMRGQASALIVIPQGFQNAVLAGKRADIRLAKNPLHTYAPEMAQGVLEIGILLGNGLYAQARQPLARIWDMQETAHTPTADEIADLSRGFFEAGRRLRNLDMINEMTVEVKRPGREASSPWNDRAAFFAYVFPGLCIFALLFIGQSLAARLLRDRTRGLQRRLTITPASRTDVLGGGVLYVVTALLLSLVVLAALGTGLFGIPLRNPAALALGAVGFAVFAAGLHLLILSLAKTDRTASFVGTVVILVLSLLGGTFMPAETYPAWLQRIAFVTPNGATQQAFVELLAHQRALAAVAGLILTTWVWGLCVLSAAVIMERRRLHG